MVRDEDDHSGEFDIHGDGGSYHTLKFCYNEKEFDNIHNLMEYNVLLHKEVFKWARLTWYLELS